MTATVWAWLAVAGVLAVLDWAAVSRADRRLERVAKPLVLLALIGAAVVGSPTHAGVHGWLIAALVLGLVGDIALVAQPEPVLAQVAGTSYRQPKVARLQLDEAGSRSSQLFLLGLGAFLIGHVSYAIGMYRYGVDRLSVIFGLVLVLIGVLSFGYRIIAGAHALGGAPLTSGITLYVVALGSAVVLGVGTQTLPIAGGIVLFAVSDLLLAYDRFVQARLWAPLAVVVSYHVAQFLLVIGLLS